MDDAGYDVVGIDRVDSFENRCRAAEQPGRLVEIAAEVSASQELAVSDEWFSYDSEEELEDH